MKNETKVWIMVGLGITLLLITLCSCSSTKYYTHKRGSVPNISTPSKRDIRNAMKYSTWEYNSVSTSSYIYQNTSSHWK